MRLRSVLVIAFAVVTAIPVLVLGAWLHYRMLEHELAGVREQHLVLARNLGGALERYARDAESVFRVAIESAADGSRARRLGGLLRDLQFRHVCLVDPADGRVEVCFSPEPELCPTRIPEARLAEFRARATADRATFTEVLRDESGAPTIFLLQWIGGRLGVGALETGYFVDLGRSIAFGRAGHAAIFDQRGRVIYHPSDEARRAIADLSALPPVRMMRAGEAGVSQFFSPVAQAEMIAGVAAVRGPGWGVMVPQPIAELEAQTASVRWAAVGMGALGLLAAVLVSWLLAGFLTRPVSAVARAAAAVAGGRLKARVDRLSGLAPRELEELRVSFNAMADAIDAAQREQVRALRETEAANRTKTAFLATVSHELRTPLNAVIGFSAMMKDQILGPIGNRKYVDYAHDINTSGMHLLGIINDILDLSKAEAGKLSLDEGPVDVAAAIRDSVAILRDHAAAGGVTLEVEVPAGLPPLHADPRRLRQILINLLSNAVKFTPAGGRVGVTASREPSGSIAVSVADTGIGIAAEDIPRALAPFSQVESPMNRRHQGTGLGLPLTRTMVELHGGTLDIRSTPGAGTTVSVRFPPERTLPDAAPPARAASA